MKFIPLPLAGCYKIELKKVEDHRGFFARIICEEELAEKKLETNWRQINTSYTKLKGSIRGMHFQYPPKAETKIVSCVSGAVWDVIVDLRKESSTFGQWYGLELNSVTKGMLYIPKGFAHGFQTLSDNTELIYFHSEMHSIEHEGGLSYNDISVSIEWPLEPTNISDRDRKLVSLDQVMPIEL